MGACWGCLFCMSVCIMYVCRIYIQDVCVIDDCVAVVGLRYISVCLMPKFEMSVFDLCLSVINVCLGNDCVALIAISFLWWNLLSSMPLSGISVCWMAEMSLFNAQIWNVCLRSVSVCDQCQKVQKSWRHTNRSKPFSIRRFRTEASSTKDLRHSADRHFKFGH